MKNLTLAANMLVAVETDDGKLLTILSHVLQHPKKVALPVFIGIIGNND